MSDILSVPNAICDRKEKKTSGQILRLVINRIPKRYDQSYRDLYCLHTVPKLEQILQHIINIYIYMYYLLQVYRAVDWIAVSILFRFFSSSDLRVRMLGVGGLWSGGRSALIRPFMSTWSGLRVRLRMKLSSFQNHDG